ncbi:MAG: hypothetical protein ACR2PX_08700 [Endozoicomonas sp.]|uniref:hypothetical protein n=1 Tax=Endozoicomonas sp. TaxID=1892382 RepID=UPI003D9B4BED
MADVHQLMQSCQDRKLCSREVSLYETPDGWSWSHGKAKALGRQIVVRHLTTPGRLHSSKSTTLSLKDSFKPELTPEEAKQVENYFDPSKSNLFVSWTSGGILGRSKYLAESQNRILRLVSRIEAEFRGFFGRHAPQAMANYKTYKLTRLSKSAKQKLEDSDLALQRLKRGSKSEEFKEWAKVKPYSYQKKAKNVPHGETTGKAATYHMRDEAKWQRRTEKVYLPSIGDNKNTESGENVFVMFGLDQENMRRSWTQVVHDQGEPFRTVSRYNNCSEMSLRILKSGGSDQYCAIHPRIYTTPNNIDQYSRKLMERLEGLNDKADTLCQRFRNSQSELTPYNLDMAREAFDDSLRGALPRSVKKQLRAVRSAVSQFTGSENRLDIIIPKAIKLVEVMDKAYQAVGDKPDAVQALSPALSVFMIVRNLIAQASAPGSESDFPEPPTASQPLFSQDDQ